MNDFGIIVVMIAALFVGFIVGLCFAAWNASRGSVWCDLCGDLRFFGTRRCVRRRLQPEKTVDGRTIYR